MKGFYRSDIKHKVARDLMVPQHSPERFGLEYVEYYQIVRDLIEEYRLLFIEWVAGFDKWDYIIDWWGLFNPPGIGPFDKDPDDGLQFHGFETIYLNRHLKNFRKCHKMSI